jgi:PKD-like domain
LLNETIVRHLKLLLFSFFLSIVVTPLFAQYEGGDNDGAGLAVICVTALDGTLVTSIAPAITGSPDFCEGSTESYFIDITNPPSNTYYIWSAPAGSVVSQGQGTNTVIITFGATPGNVSVDIITDCGIVTRTLAVSSISCPFYSGGDSDGFSEIASCVTTLDGGPLINVGAAITGSPDFCENSTESYYMQVDNAPANIYYNWSVPAGSVITQGQGTHTILVTFGSTSGNVSVDIITDCFTITRTLGVSSAICPFYSGGNNDGFSQAPSCATTLDGGSVYTVTGIVGSSTFCEFGNESFSAVTVNAPPNTYYNWTVPVDATILSGQGTATILVAFGNTNGSISVDVITDCTSVTPAAFPVTVTSCSFYSGGDNDGSSAFLNCATKLDGTPALVPGPIVGSITFCDFATETYTIAVDGVNAETTYTWSVPAGATITSGQGTPTILVTFSNNSGNISVNIANLCTVINVALPVTTTNCIFYAGGDNDGFASTQQCASNLNGGSVFIPGPIVGPANSCEFSTESYSITVAGSLPSTVYAWTVPAGASIISGQGTTTILVAFGNSNGNVAVDISNECETQNVSFPVTVANCIFYSGGNSDGFSVVQQCASNLNGGSTFIPGPIVGTAASCEFSTESYSITVAGSLPSTVYVWSVPAGASIISGQGTTTILVAFGNTSGNIAVAISNECETQNVTLPVSVANCIFYAGGDGDGFSTTRTCISNLDGGSAFIAGPIVGTATFCNFASDSYSIAVAGANSTTVYVWTVPAGSVIVSGQGTNTILVSFGNTSGNVAVAVSNECETQNVSLPVTASNCIFYAGGNSDGFAVTTITNSPLPIALVSFDASVENGIVYLKWETSSEYENDFFLIERSEDGKTFESFLKVDGAGTSHGQLKYQARDTNPFRGTSYYRLSQTDYDGTVTYFRVLIIKVESFGEVTKLYPNPVDRDALLHIDYFAEEDGLVKISIVDPAGTGSESQMVNVKAGVNLFEFTPHFKSSGVHVIIIRSRDKAQALRLVVL